MRILADIRIIECSEFMVDFSTFTGETDLLVRRTENTHDNPLET